MRCPYCGEHAEWVPNEVVYGKRYGKSYMIYLCRKCDARVGCHLNSHKALGTMANKELREWRQKAHAMFDPLWKTGIVSRTEAYQILRNEFNGASVHIGEADIETCQKIIRLFTPPKNDKQKSK